MAQNPDHNQTLTPSISADRVSAVIAAFAAEIPSSAWTSLVDIYGKSVVTEQAVLDHVRDPPGLCTPPAMTLSSGCAPKTLSTHAERSGIHMGGYVGTKRIV